jgi:hypothetical protein
MENVRFRKSRRDYAKQISAFALAAAACLSLMAAPASEPGLVSSGFSGITVNATTVSTVVPTNIKREPIKSSVFGNVGLTPNAWYKSPNGQYFLVFSKSEGNLVLYHNTPKGRKPVWWSSGRRTSNGECILQNDGNLVIYETVSGKRSVCWHSGTYRDGWTTLYLDNNGNLYLYSLYAKSTKVLHYGTAWPIPDCTHVREECKDYLKLDCRNFDNFKVSKMEVRTIAKGIVEEVGNDTITIKHPLLGITSTYGPFKEIGKLDQKFYKSQQIDYDTVLGHPLNDYFYIRLKDSHTGESINPYEYLTVPDNVYFTR